MALKQLMLRKQISALRADLERLNQKDTDFETRSAEVAVAIEEAGTEEEIGAVNAVVEALEAEKGERDTAKTKLTEQIEALEGELREIEQKAPPAKNENRSDDMKHNGYFGAMTSEERQFLGRMDVRSRVAESMKDSDVRGFYEALRDAVSKKRSITSAELTIPNIVLNRIQTLIGDYGKLYSEVDVVPLNGTARVILDGANPEGIWVEMCDPVQELSTGFTAVELDGYKVGGFIPVCNAVLEDSMINLAMYIERKLAIAIAKALDKAILLGTGDAGHQPMGIIPNLAAANVVTLDDAGTGGIFGSMFGYMSLIDTGENDVGEVVAVMKRSTYYSRIAPRLVIVNSGGTYTLPNIQAPTFAGMRVVLSQYVPDNQVLIGDFKKYLLSERAGVKLASSTDVRFIEDQTVFKGTARYDGKPVHLDASDKTADWVLATIPELAPVNP